MLLLGVWLILTGLIPLLNLASEGLGTLLAVARHCCRSADSDREVTVRAESLARSS